MAWQDRDYNRVGGSGGGGLNFGRVLSFFNWSFPVGTYLDIRVRVHITFVLLIAFQLLSSSDHLWTLRWAGLLFMSVLLHEFGHCLACRRVGGFAHDILMWPLGGLAMCAPPRRAWPTFVTVAGGPLVTFAIAAIAFVVLLTWFGQSTPVSLNPFQMWRGGWHSGFAGVLRDLFLVNYTLLLFNMLLAFYPFDGGQIVQTILWARFGYTKSMRWAAAIGMAGAGGLALFGVVNGQLWLIIIAVFGFLTSYRINQAIAASGGMEEPYDPGYERVYQRQKGGNGWLARWRQRKLEADAARRRRQNEKMQDEVDRILAKVKDKGLQSLTRGEKKTLQEATDRQRRVG